jgi:hypothetical protein
MQNLSILNVDFAEKKVGYQDMPFSKFDDYLLSLPFEITYYQINRMSEQKRIPSNEICKN